MQENEKNVFHTRNIPCVFRQARLYFSPMDNLRTEIPHVAVKIQGTLHTHRELLRGIMRYVQLNGPWTIHLLTGREDDTPIHNGQTFSGYIGNIPQPHGCRSPIVIFQDTPPPSKRRPKIPRNVCGILECDNASLSQAAVAYFRTRGFTNFAFVGFALETSWSNARQRAFVQELAKHGLSCSIFPRVSNLEETGLTSEEGILGDWLARLPEHTALFVANDIRAHQVLNICQQRSIAVPQHLSILSCDDDEIICGVTMPSLSSIRHNTFRTGYVTAEILDRAMRERHWGSPPVRIRYGFDGITTRQSTTALYESVPLVKRALEFIRVNAGENMTVKLVASTLNVSSRLLQMRFRATMKKTVRDVILDTRLERAKKLLACTSESIDWIAAKCGFANASHFCVVFRRKIGTTPTNYRRQS